MAWGLLGSLRFLLFFLSLLAQAHGETHLNGDLLAPNLVRLTWAGHATDIVAVEMATNLVEGFQKTVARDLPASASVNAVTMELSGVSQAFFRLNVASNAPPRNLFEDFEDDPTLFVQDGAARGGWCDVAVAPESSGLALRIGWETNHFAFQEIHFDQPQPVLADEGVFALRLYSPDPCVGGQVAYFNLRLSDATGEIFQWMRRVHLDRAGWYDVFYPVRAGEHTVSWGDHADGIMDPPLALLGFSLDYHSGSQAAGMLVVDDIRFEQRVDLGVRAHLVTSQFPSILRPGDESRLAVSLSNETSGTRSLLVHVELENECAVAVRHPLAVTLPPHTSRTLPIPLPPDAKRGLWRAHLAIRAGDADSDTTQRDTLSFALMEPAGPKPLDPGDGFLIGLHSHPHRWSAADREKEALAAGACGARIVRTGDFWEGQQPASNRWEWSVMDDVVDLFGAQGIEIQAVLGFTPRWAAPPEVRDAPDWWIWNRAPPVESAWRTYVRAFAARYADRIRFYEAWNEPDLTGFFRGTSEDYLGMLRQAHEEIKFVNPALQVMTGGFAITSVAEPHGNPELHRRVLEEGQAWFDVHAFHGHGGFSWFANEVEGALLPLRVAANATGKPLYFNECAEPSTRIGEREQAETLFKKMLFAWSRGAMGYHWYNLRNDGFDAKNDEHNYGLLTHDFQPKAAYVAFNTLSAHFDGKTFIRSYDVGPGRHLLLFADDHEQILAFWGAPMDCADDTITLQTDAASAGRIDLMGNRFPHAISNGTLRLPLDREPMAIILDQPTAPPTLH